MKLQNDMQHSGRNLKRKKAEESKKRTHRLCQIGGAVESVLGCPIEEEDLPKLIGFLKRQETNGKVFLKSDAERTSYRYGGSVMAEGVVFPFPSLPLNEGRTYGQPEVVLISLPQVATGLRLRLPGSFRRRGFQPDLLMPQGHSCAEGVPTASLSAKPEEDAVAEINAGYGRKGESYHGDISFYSKDCRTQ